MWGCLRGAPPLTPLAQWLRRSPGRAERARSPLPKQAGEGAVLPVAQRRGAGRAALAAHFVLRLNAVPENAPQLVSVRRVPAEHEARGERLRSGGAVKPAPHLPSSCPASARLLAVAAAVDEDDDVTLRSLRGECVLAAQVADVRRGSESCRRECLAPQTHHAALDGPRRPRWLRRASGSLRRGRGRGAVSGAHQQGDGGKPRAQGTRSRRAAGGWPLTAETRAAS